MLLLFLSLCLVHGVSLIGRVSMASESPSATGSKPARAISYAGLALIILYRKPSLCAPYQLNQASL